VASRKRKKRQIKEERGVVEGKGQKKKKKSAKGGDKRIKKEKTDTNAIYRVILFTELKHNLL